MAATVVFNIFESQKSCVNRGYGGILETFIPDGSNMCLYLLPTFTHVAPSGVKSL